MGSQPICASKWVCKSMNPGVTIMPAASISFFAEPSTSPNAVMMSPQMPRSAKTGSLPLPSTSRPPRMMMSYSILLPSRFVDQAIDSWR